MQEYEYIYDFEKNRKLKETRGIGFDEVIFAIDNGHLLKISPHHNSSKYPNQSIMVVEINQYIYLVPFVKDGNKRILKTIYPSRKATMIYLKDKREFNNEH